MIGYSIPRLEEIRVLFHRGDEPVDCCFITTLWKVTGRDWFGLCLRLLLCDLEDDIESDRHPEAKAGNSDYQPNRRFLDAKDISKQVRDGVSHSGLVKEVPGGCYEHSELNDAS